jgi:quercetin dioxygenase-like cupin family protein
VAWATPGSNFATTPLVRSTAAVRVNVKTHSHTLNDLQVQSVVAQPGGYSGWHSHPGYGIVAVAPARRRSTTETIQHVRRVVSAGEVFAEEPGHVHFVVNEGTVPYKAFATFIMPVGVLSRTHAPSPGTVRSELTIRSPGKGRPASRPFGCGCLG